MQTVFVFIADTFPTAKAKALIAALKLALILAALFAVSAGASPAPAVDHGTEITLEHGLQNQSDRDAAREINRILDL